MEWSREKGERQAELKERELEITGKSETSTRSTKTASRNGAEPTTPVI